MFIHTKRSLLYTSILMFTAFVSSSFTQDFDQVQIQTIPVSDGVYMLVGRGGNIGVCVGEDGVLLIDSQFAELSEKIKAAIAEIDSGPIRFVLNTHWHYDHAEGNEPLGRSGAVIMAHSKTRERMMAEQYHPSFDRRIPAYPETALPVVTFADSITLHFNNDEIQIFHLERAHSDADLAFYFRKANVIHLGDLYFVGGYPFIDVPHEGSIDGLSPALDKVLGLINENTKVIPGHGRLSNREELQEYRDMLVTLRDRIKRQIKKGKTLEEIVASKPTADFDETRQLMIPPDNFVKILFRDLSGR